MRGAPRHPILQRCFVRFADASSSDAWKCIAYNISTTGIGITMPIRLQKDAVLTIQAWNLPQACTLQARVVQMKQVEFLWFTGCEFLKRLSPTELQIWRSGPVGWLEEFK
jgi:hypothetical protein